MNVLGKNLCTRVTKVFHIDSIGTYPTAVPLTQAALNTKPEQPY